MTWWCFDRHKLKQALEDYGAEVLSAGRRTPNEIRDELARLERFFYSDQMKRHDNCRDDDGQRDFENDGGTDV